MMRQQVRLSHMIMRLRHSHDQPEAVPALTRVINYALTGNPTVLNRHNHLRSILPHNSSDQHKRLCRDRGVWGGAGARGVGACQANHLERKGDVPAPV